MADRAARGILTACAAALFTVIAGPAPAQTITHDGFAEVVVTLYPQTAPNDTTRAIAAPRLRWNPSAKWSTWRLDGSFEARTDSHDMTSATATYTDRTSRRPALAVRRWSASWARGPLTVEVGKQFVRWGKTDIVIPTERFAPKDYMEVVTTDTLAVTAARATVANSAGSLDVVVTPWMTPSRLPLFDQRWVVAPAAAQGLPLRDAGAQFPDGPQIGARLNRIARRGEFSVSAFRGYNHLPQFLTTVVPAPLRVDVVREYPQLTSVGADASVDLPWLTLKGETAWFGSSTPGTEEFVLYVLQAERQVGEWLFIGGYAGEHVTEKGTKPRFAPDRGLAKAMVGRASYTIDTNRSLVFEGVLRQNGDGFSARGEYSQAMGPHMRLTGGVRLIRGEPDDFLGQYRRNSSASIAWRYSF